MEDGREFLENLERRLGAISQVSGEQIIFNSKIVGTYADKGDNTVGKAPLSRTAKEAYAEYETRAAKLGLPSYDDSPEMDDIVVEKMVDEWIDKILELM